MSTQGQQAAKLNKKQRRKHTRAHTQKDQALDDEQEENVQAEAPVSTEKSHPEVNGAASREPLSNAEIQVENVDRNFEIHL